MQFKNGSVHKGTSAIPSPGIVFYLGSVLLRTKWHLRNPMERDVGCSCARNEGDKNMLGIIAAVLIVLWLLGFFAFHVTSAVIHIALVVGLILLVLHLVSGRAANV
jgi:hypothetical protein